MELKLTNVLENIEHFLDLVEKQTLLEEEDFEEMQNILLTSDSSIEDKYSIILDNFRYFKNIFDYTVEEMLDICPGLVVENYSKILRYLVNEYTKHTKTEDVFVLNGNKIFYHASYNKRKGRLKKSTAPQFGEGIYFSTNKELVINAFGPHLTEAELTINNPVYTNTKEWYDVEMLAIKQADNEYGKRNELTLDEDDTYYRYDPEDLSELAEIPSYHISNVAKKLGYDAIIDKDSGSYGNEIVVLDESKIIYIN